MTYSPAPPPETPVLPVTLERVGEIFDAEGLQFLARADAIETGAPNTALRLVLHKGLLRASGRWRGILSRPDALRALMACNTWNTSHPFPTLTLMATAPEVPQPQVKRGGLSDISPTGSGTPRPGYTVTARRNLVISQGASRHQLGAFLVDTYGGILDAFAFIEQNFPHAVTWEQPHE